MTIRFGLGQDISHPSTRRNNVTTVIGV